jgi:hypothetical protein
VISIFAIKLFFPALAALKTWSCAEILNAERARILVGWKAHDSAPASRQTAKLSPTRLFVLIRDNVKNAKSRNLNYLRKSQVDGNRLRDVKESPISGDGKREAVERLQNVSALVLVEHLQGQPCCAPSRRWIALRDERSEDDLQL